MYVMENADDYSALSNEDVFALLRNNDSKAFETLYRRYGRRIYAYCLRVLRDADAVEDAYQYIFGAMYESRNGFAGGDFEAWLFTIARRHCQRIARKMKRSVTFDLTDETAAGTVDNRGPEALASSELEAAIATLSEPLRKAVKLRYYQDYSYKEIAGHLGISVSAAKLRVLRAKLALRERLAPHAEDSHEP